MLLKFELGGRWFGADWNYLDLYVVGGKPAAMLAVMDLAERTIVGCAVKFGEPTESELARDARRIALEANLPKPHGTVRGGRKRRLYRGPPHRCNRTQSPRPTVEGGLIVG